MDLERSIPLNGISRMDHPEAHLGAGREGRLKNVLETRIGPLCCLRK